PPDPADVRRLGLSRARARSELAALEDHLAERPRASVLGKPADRRLRSRFRSNGMSGTRRSRVGAAALLVAALVSSAAAQDAVAPPHGPGVIGAPAGTGPYPAVAEVAASLPGNTIYHPRRLPSRAVPIVLWGNGACR